MRVCLFEDSLVADLEPISLTRPVFTLLCGCVSLAEKQYRHFSAEECGVLVRPVLANLFAEQNPQTRVNDLGWLRWAPIVLVNGRWLPPAPGSVILPEPGRPCVGLVEGEVAFAVLTPEMLWDCSPLTIDACVEQWKESLPAVEAGGRVVQYLWELVDQNAREIALDGWFSEPERARRSDRLPPIVGPDDRVWIDPTARIDPLVVLDSSGGPVIIDREAVITAFSRLEGPCYIGPGTQVMGAKIRAGTTLGPQCRIGGEVETAIIQGYSNKYHDGFLGHAYVGEWVNLGAGTSNSDLRNDYGPVKVMVRGRLVDTGRNKIGCFLGDHTKAGLGCLLNTGTNAGIFTNLLPTGGLLPRCIPSFSSIWNGNLIEHDNVENLLQTAAKAMSRRGKPLTPTQESLYRELYHSTAPDRQWMLREGVDRRLRQSA